ncbi:MAG: hypothetical protein AABW58_04445 [Nanoarchaeota archaeon]
MVEAKCKECGALFVIDMEIPKEMECFCGSEVFETIEKPMIIA